MTEEQAIQGKEEIADCNCADSGGEAETSQISETILFMLFLIWLNEYIIHLVNMARNRFQFMSLVQTSSVTTLVGVLAGLILMWTGIIDIVSLLQSGFSSFFLIVFLPAILYESAINMDKKYFFRNFGSILLYAILGTIIAIFASTFLIYLFSWMGLQGWSLRESFAFSSLISATDPVAVLGIFKQIGVDKNLFILIFGESILNDAVSIILFNTSLSEDEGRKVSDYAIDFMYILLGSMTIGFLIGIASAYSLKDKAPTREHQDNKEQTVLLMVPFISYLIAESANLSGIVSIVFCGITMARYALPNVSQNSKKMNQRFFHTLAYNFENIIFLFIGIGFVCFDLAWKRMGFFFFLLTFLILQFARYLNVVSVTSILNRYRVQNKINFEFQLFIWFSGFRGAMAFALSMQSMVYFKQNEVGQVMLTITMCLAIINIFVNATLLIPLVNMYDIRHNRRKSIEPDQNQNQNHEENPSGNPNNASSPNNNENELSPDQNQGQNEQLMQSSNKGFWNKLKELIAMCDESLTRNILIGDRSQNSSSQVENDEQQNSNYSIQEIQNQFEKKQMDIIKPLRPSNPQLQLSERFPSKQGKSNSTDQGRRKSLNYCDLEEEDEEPDTHKNQDQQNHNSNENFQPSNNQLPQMNSDEESHTH